VLEPLSGYLALAAELYQREELHGEPFNFGPPVHQNHTVLELVQSISQYWHKVHWEDNSGDEKQPSESGLLKLNCDKALHHLNWQTVLTFQETVRMIGEWYSSYYKEPSTIRDVTLSHIHEYETNAREKGMRWIQ
jgi:CDP-glucose 4,6-dehydratase